MTNLKLAFSSELISADEPTAIFERDLLHGLEHRPRSISPKYFYDATGSILFDQICALPEYYPTRAEISILAQHGKEIASQIGPDAEIIEFGAGSLNKVSMILDAFESASFPRRYLPIDISGQHMEDAAVELRKRYPTLAVQPVIGDYTAPIRWPTDPAQPHHRAGFFPGSTLGNFHPDEALSFLKTASHLLHGGGLLVGVDLVKDPKILHAAYNDSQGVTAAFNLNVLARANRELGANFDLDGFFHHATYNPEYQRVEMHLISRRVQVVDISNRRFTFNEGDHIHTESSYKYTVEGLRKLARLAGFQPGPVWQDNDGLFSIHWLKAPNREARTG